MTKDPFWGGSRLGTFIRKWEKPMSCLKNLKPPLQKPSLQGFLVLLSSPGRKVPRRAPHPRGAGRAGGSGLAFSGLLLSSCSDAEHWAWAVSCLLHHNWWLSKGPGVRRFKHQAEHCIIAMIIDPLLNVPITWAKPFALYIAWSLTAPLLYSLNKELFSKQKGNLILT